MTTTTQQAVRRLDDLSKAAVERVLERAAASKRGESIGRLEETTLAMVFEQPSTRTRVSFETGMTQLGGHAQFLGADDLQLDRGEPIEDTARVLSRYVDCVVARVEHHSRLTRLADAATVPVVNGLTDAAHPCQTLADLQTIRETVGFDGQVTWVGDVNNVCRSLARGAAMVGLDLTIATPDETVVDSAQTSGDGSGQTSGDGSAQTSGDDSAQTSGDGSGQTSGDGSGQSVTENAGQSGVGRAVTVTTNPAAGVAGADVVYTDVWTSMADDTTADYGPAFRVDRDLLAGATDDAVVMHCLPAHRGEEITAAVLDGPQSVVWEQAENRLHAQKALLVELLG